MIAALKHAARVLFSIRREAKKREKRSSRWPAVEKAHLAKHGACAACGGKQRLQVHHEQPFHEHPELELDPKNLITLCMGKLECHIRIGHGDSFQFYNPNVVRDAREVYEHPEMRARIELDAKAHRLVNHGD